MPVQGLRLAAAVALAAAVGTAEAAPLDIAAANGLDRARFVELFGPVFEKSPWVAEAVFDKRPFPDAPALYQAMVAVVSRSPLPKQLALLKAHPDLAGKEAAAGAMTASSVAEQAGAGLNALTKAEADEIARLNATHEERFGFPFIFAVGSRTKGEIIAAFRKRMEDDTQAEYAEDLRNVYAIAKLRLTKLVAGL